MRNEVGSEIRDARESFEYRLAQNIKEDQKAFYAYVRSESKSRSEIWSLRWKDKRVDDDEGEAELLNEYFVTVFTEEDVNMVASVRIMEERKIVTDINITEDIF